MRLSRAGLLLVLGSAPFLFGAAYPWTYALLGIAASILLLAFLIPGLLRGQARARPGAPLAALILLFVLGIVQLLPLPATWRSALAPEGAPDHRIFEPGAEPLGAEADAALRDVFPEGAGYALSYATGSTRAELMRLSLYAIVLVLSAATLTGRRDSQALAWVATGAGGALSLIGLSGYGGLGHAYRELAARFPYAYGTYSNRNHFAGFLELALPLGLALVVGSWLELKRRPDRALLALTIAALLSALMLVALVDCGSRGGLVGGFTGLAVLSLLLWRDAATRLAGRWLFLGALAALGAYLLFGGGQAFEHVAATRPEEPSIQDRIMVWKASLRMIAAYPLAGVGLGAFADAFPRFKPQGVRLFFEHPENDFLKLLAEGGAVALVALGLFAAATLKAVRERLKRASRPAGDTGDRPAEGPRDLWWAAASAGVASLLVHGLFDVNLHITANAMLFTALFAIVVEPRPEQRSAAPTATAPRPGRYVLALVVAIGVLAWDFQLVRVAQADRLAGRVLRGDLAAAPAPTKREVLEAAIARDPKPVPPVFALGKLAAGSALAETPSARRDAELGFRYLGRACRAEPGDAVYAFELGWLAAMWGSRPQQPVPALMAYGERLMRHAISLDPVFPGLRGRFGLFLVFAGEERLSEGLSELRAAFTESPDTQDALIQIVEQRLPPILVSNIVPDRPENRFRYASLLDGFGERDRAVRQYERVLALAAPLARERAREFQRRVALKHNRYRFELALPLWQELVAASPVEVQDLRGLARALEGLGRLEEAQAALASALALRASSDLRVELARLAWRAGDCATAIEAAAGALAAESRNPGALLVTALCQERRGDLGAAADTLRRISTARLASETEQQQLDELGRRLAAALGAPGSAPAEPEIAPGAGGSTPR